MSNCLVLDAPLLLAVLLAEFVQTPNLVDLAIGQIAVYPLLRIRQRGSD